MKRRNFLVAAAGSLAAIPSLLRASLDHKALSADEPANRPQNQFGAVSYWILDPSLTFLERWEQRGGEWFYVTRTTVATTTL